MSSYYGYGYAHPYYYPSVGAWPWAYVGQVPATSPTPTFPTPPYRGPRLLGPGETQTLDAVRNALIQWFMEVNNRPPSDLDLADFVIQAALGAYSQEHVIAAGGEAGRLMFQSQQQIQARLAELMKRTFSTYKGQLALNLGPVLPQGL